MLIKYFKFILFFFISLILIGKRINYYNKKKKKILKSKRKKRELFSFLRTFYILFNQIKILQLFQEIYPFTIFLNKKNLRFICLRTFHAKHKSAKRRYPRIHAIESIFFLTWFPFPLSSTDTKSKFKEVRGDERFVSTLN